MLKFYILTTLPKFLTILICARPKYFQVLIRPARSWPILTGLKVLDVFKDGTLRKQGMVRRREAVRRTGKSLALERAWQWGMGNGRGS